MAPQIPIERPAQRAVLTMSILFSIIPVTFCVLRYVSRRIANRPLDASDWLIFAACLVTVAYQSVCIACVVYGGVGFHVAEIVETYGMAPVFTLLKLAIPIQVLWTVALALTKTSILVLYTKVFSMKALIIIARITGVAIIAWSLATILMAFLMCQPFAFNWDQTIPGGHCGDQVLSYKFTGAINLVTDIVVLILPMPYLYGLRLELYKKLVLMVTFAVGFFTCIVTIFRLISLTSLNYQDLTYSITEAMIFSPLEPALGVTLACVPVLRPLLGRGKYSASGTLRPDASDRSANSKGSAKRGTFAALSDDGWQYQLRPAGPRHEVAVYSAGRPCSADDSSGRDVAADQPVDADRPILQATELINVKSEWTVTSERKERQTTNRFSV